MTGRFVQEDDLVLEDMGWGEVCWLCRPSLTGATKLAVVEVILPPGGGHSFHRHPRQEEVITVKSGRIEQWIDQDRRELGPGEAAFIPADTVHASFGLSQEPARLVVAIGPCVGEDGYEVVDVFDQEPWRSLRDTG